jgi:hypothetical protein
MTNDNVAPEANWTYQTIKQFCQRNPAFTAGGIRHNIFYEETNGLKESGAIVRNGGRILIHEIKFFAWIETRSGKGVLV